MSQRFRRVIAQPGGDRNSRVTVDHKGIVRVIDDCGKFHLENSIKLLNDGTNVKLESPCHRGSPSAWRYPNQSPLEYYRVSTATSERPGIDAVPLGEEAESCKRCRAGPAPVWNNCETKTGDLVEIEALFFALVGGSPGAEIVLLNQNLAVRPAAVLRDFHAHFLGTLPHRLLDLIDKARDRLRPVKLNDDVFGGVGASADPARGAGPAAAVQHMLDRMSRILGRIGDR